VLKFGFLALGLLQGELPLRLARIGPKCERAGS